MSVDSAQQRGALSSGSEHQMDDLAPTPASAAPQSGIPAALLQRKMALRVQRRAAGASTGDVHQAAAEGLQGTPGQLPYLQQIQASFGPYQVGDVDSHHDKHTQTAGDKMGAEAYASGNKVAFAKTPDLHTAAHEAAHIVQQRHGVNLPGGVGQEGDAHERHADAVADRVVKGESAADLLHQSAGGGTVQAKAVQHKPKKHASGTAHSRLPLAVAAIKHTKEAITFGAGNQYDALKASNFNSYFRMKVMRDPSCWVLSDSVRALAAANPDSLTAAKADLAHGGNCGEHAQVAFDYLRVHAVGHTISRTDVEGLDHAFIIMGDLHKDTDSDLVVSDPWPTAATATLWEDHFAFTADRSKINTRNSMVADGKNVKQVIAAGLKLSPKGEAMVKQSFTPDQSKKELDKGVQGDHPWIWGQADSAGEGQDYTYTH